VRTATRTLGFLLLACALGQAQSSSDMQNMPGMTNMPGMKDAPSTNAAADENDAPMQAMSTRHMDMGPHMKMTALRPIQPGDQEKAAKIVVAARQAAEKYTDYKVALADGYKIFHPEVPQKQYHFTNYMYAFEAARAFNPDHPTSLLYEKQGDGYKLVGVMYTARKGTSEEELNNRVPLSIAQWHEHVNICLPPADKGQDALTPKQQFGFRGSITTQEACDAAGGRFRPQIFGWMVHVYPFEQKPEDIWSAERQHDEHMD